MSSEIPPTSLIGKRKRKNDPNPNPLFCKWLAEWRDEAKQKGWKSEYIYSKALRSLQKYPLPLSTGKECKILQHFGDKICKMLDDRLLQHKQEQENLSSLKNFDSDFPTSSTSGTFHTRVPVAVHEISDSSDEGSCASDYLNSAVCGKTTAAQAYNGISMSVGEPCTKQTLLSATVASVVTVDCDDDKEVSFIGRTSPIRIDELNVSDDDLPRLPDSDEGNRERKKSSAERCKIDNMLHAGDIGQAKTAFVARVTHSISDSDGEEEGRAVEPQRPGGRGMGRQPKEYTPAYRSGPYAILLTLFRQAQDPDFRGFMTKAELCRAAQPLADKSFTVPDPGSRYTAWSSVSVLVKKGLLTKESSPAKYRLTDQGCELAHRLEDVERRHAAGPFQNRGDKRDDGIIRGADVHGPLVTETDDGTDLTHTTDKQTKKTPEKTKTKQKENSGTSTITVTAMDCFGASSSVGHNMVEVREENPAGSENHDYIVVEDLKEGEDDSDDDDELPALTLPSLTERLRPPTSTAPSETVETSEKRRLQFWYVAEGDKLVSRKDQASVSVDETGLSFLVKINYQHLLQSGSKYKLDMTRPLGDDFVFAYLSDMDCYEEAQPPSEASECLTATAANKSSKTDTKRGPVHEISDSDSEEEPIISKSNIVPGTSYDVPAPPSHSSSKLVGMTGGLTLPAGRSSLSTAALNHKAKSVVKTAAESAGSALVRVPSSSTSQNLVDNVMSSGSDPDVEDFVLWPGTFEIVLCVDNREFYGSNSSSKTLLPDLIKNGVNCELRLLNVGDVLWVAREKMAAEPQPLGMPGNAQPAKRRELVLNYIVERKRMDDLVSSMISGRLKEQKFRLKHSGIQEKIILIEHYGSMQHFSISEDRIKQGIANTEIIDGFTVKQTGNSKETASYLTMMTRFLQSYFQSKTLQSGSRDTIKNLGIKFHVNDKEQMLMPFDHFNQLSMKNKPLTVMELFGKQLIQLWGMSAEKARAIVDKYPTPSILMKAYTTCTSEKEKESLLANVKYGKNHRNLGIALSRQVSQLYTSKVLT